MPESALASFACETNNTESNTAVPAKLTRIFFFIFIVSSMRSGRYDRKSISPRCYGEMTALLIRCNKRGGPSTAGDARRVRGLGFSPGARVRETRDDRIPNTGIALGWRLPGPDDSLRN